MKSRKLLLTFDYELFLGKNSGSVNKCIIEPTDVIFRILNSRKAKAIFFVDGTYLWHLSEIKDTNSNASLDYEAIRLQLSKLYDHGHYIYLHIHPHWIDAIYDADLNFWNLTDKKNFSFGNLTEFEREKVFKSSFNALKEILNDKPAYMIEGFRAGGLYIQPFSDFKLFFEEFGIKYDFSILPGFSSQNESYSFNYQNISTDNIFKFKDDVTEKSDFGHFYEFPISIFNMRFIPKLLNSIWYRFLLSRADKMMIGNGFSSGNILTSKKVNINHYFRTKETYSIELLNTFKAILYTKNLKEKKYIQLISHPKLVSNYNLLVFDKWLTKLNSKYNLDTDFKNFVVK